MSHARLLAFDAETYATFDALARERVAREAALRRPSVNTPRALKLTWDESASRSERAQEAVAKTAVDVLLAEPLCVCFAVHDGRRAMPVDVSAVSMMDAGDPLAAQRAGLQELAAYWEEVTSAETIWAGHNIVGFDLPLLLNAWTRNGVAPPTHFPEYLGGRWRGRVFDTMLRVPSKTPFLSLDNACAGLKVPMPAELDWRGECVSGALVGEMYEAGDYEAILEYCAADIPPVVHLYAALTGDDTRRTWDREAKVSTELEEVFASETGPGVKLMAVRGVLERAGLIARA